MECLKKVLYRMIYIFFIIILISMINCGGGEQVRQVGYSSGSVDEMGGTGSKIVIAEGLAEVREAGLPDAYDRAEEAAKAKAIEKALGTIIDARTIGSSGVILESEIFAKKQGYIRKSEIVSKREEDGIAYVTVKAEVGMQKLKDDVMGLNILQHRMNMPKTIVFIQEESLGKPSKQKASYNKILEKFKEKKFTFVSPSSVSAAQRKKIKKLYEYMETGDENEFISTAGKIGFSLNTDIVIVGKAVSTKAGKVMEGSKLMSYQADVDFKVVNVGDGEIIAQSSKHGAMAHINDNTGSIKAIEKASSAASDDLLDQILKAWEDKLNNGNLITLKVRGLSSVEAIKFEKLLKAFYREVKEVYAKPKQGATDVYSVKFLGSSRDMAKVLVTKKRFPYTITDVKYGFGEVNVRAKRK